MSNPRRWTGPELELVARAELTTRQISEMTGRTENAVRGARRNLRIDPRKIDLAGVPRVTSPEQSPVNLSGITVDEAQEMLRQQVCPICGIGPWRSPLNHVARAHGIDRRTMRDLCGLSIDEKVTDDDARAAWASNGRKQVATLAENARNARGRKRGPARRTRRSEQMLGHGLRVHEERDPEAVAVMRAGFRERVTSPDAAAKWLASTRRANATRTYTDEERGAFTDMMRSPEVEAKRAAYHAARRQDQCTVDGCQSPHVARGYCSKHWRKWRAYGNPDGRGRVGKPPALNEAQERVAISMLGDGCSQRQVAQHFGCSPAAISRMLKRHERPV